MRRTNPRRAALLKSIPMFRGCADRELAQIDGLVDDIEVEIGEVLIQEGRLGQETFIIVTGEAVVSIGDEEVARLGPGEFFGEMALLGPDHHRSATVTAVTPMVLLVAGPPGFRDLLEVGPVAVTMLRALAGRLASAQAPAQ